MRKAKELVYVEECHNMNCHNGKVGLDNCDVCNGKGFIEIHDNPLRKKVVVKGY